MTMSIDFLVRWKAEFQSRWYENISPASTSLSQQAWNLLTSSILQCENGLLPRAASKYNFLHYSPSFQMRFFGKIRKETFRTAPLLSPDMPFLLRLWLPKTPPLSSPRVDSFSTLPPNPWTTPSRQRRSSRNSSFICWRNEWMTNTKNGHVASSHDEEFFNTEEKMVLCVCVINTIGNRIFRERRRYWKHCCPLRYQSWQTLLSNDLRSVLTSRFPSFGHQQTSER